MASIDKGEIGELLQKDDGITVEWTIKDILSYTKEDESFHSPSFSVPGSQWRMDIYPNGHTSNNSVGWISLYLRRDDDFAHPKKVDYTFTVKAAGKAVSEARIYSYVFKIKKQGYGAPEFLEKSQLQEKQLSLPEISRELTVVCTLKMEDSVECNSSLIKLSENFKDLFISKRGCDTTLKVKQEEFLAHKLVLSARSPVLAAMFEVDMKEKNTGTVDIVDCHPKAFKDFLAFLYSGVFQNHSKEVFELYRIADKYDVEDLKPACVRCMLNSLSVDNVLEAALIGHEFDENYLKSKTQEFFDEKALDILSTPKWKSFLIENFTVGNDLLKNTIGKVNSKT